MFLTKKPLRTFWEHALTRLLRRSGADRQGMDPIRELVAQNRIDHAVALDPALALEGGADNLHPEMGFALRMMVMPVTGVMMRLVDHEQRDRRQRMAKLAFYSRLDRAFTLSRHSRFSLRRQKAGTV